MHDLILDILEPLDNDKDYELEIIEGNNNFVKKGFLVSKPSNRKVPIANDIPNFNLIENNSHPQKSVYDFWWKSSHKNINYDELLSKKIFSNTIKITDEEFKNSIVLDLGCGNGRFSNIISKTHPKLLVLFDISEGIHTAYKVAKNNCSNVIAIQGNILKVPLKKNFFDIVYSWGVLHHTGNTRKAFKLAGSLLKIGGKMGIYVYENHPSYSYKNMYLRLIAIIRQVIVIDLLRFICQFLPANYVLLLFKPIYHFERLLNIGIVGCHSNGEDKFNKDHYFRIVIDRFKTRYATEHTNEEVVKWFIDENFDDIKVGNGTKVCITGTKIQNFEKLRKVEIRL